MRKDVVLELMAGRKKLPTNLKVLKGTLQKCRENPREIKPDPHIPDPPDHLDDGALEEWHRISPGLYAMGLLSDMDRTALAGYCCAYSLWVDACWMRHKCRVENPETRGLISHTKDGKPVKNPLIDVLNSASRVMQGFLSEFGLSPAMRSKVVAHKPKQDEKTADWK